MIHYWWNELLPKALYVGLSINEFWYEDPYLLEVYSKSYEMKLKDSAEQWKIKTNFKAWLQGVYIQNAVASVLSKNARYPSKPFDISKSGSDDNVKNSEDFIKERSKEIDKMLSHK